MNMNSSSYILFDVAEGFVIVNPHIQFFFFHFPLQYI